MVKRKAKILRVDTVPHFNPATDIPLRYFSTNEAFVRKSGCNNYKLYCDRWVVAMVSWDKFLYLYPSYKPQYIDYMEAFINEYAPEVPFRKVTQHLGRAYYEYIGSYELTTV